MNKDQIKNDVLSNIRYCVRHSLENHMPFKKMDYSGFEIGSNEVLLHIDNGELKISVESPKERFSIEDFKKSNKEIRKKEISRKDEIHITLEKIGTLVKNNRNWSLKLFLNLSDLVKNYKNVPVLGICSGMNLPHVIPFPYFGGDAKNEISENNDIPFERKKNAVSFFGKSSGIQKRLYEKKGTSNSRLTFSDWAYDHRDEIIAKITPHEIHDGDHFFKPNSWTLEDFDNIKHCLSEEGYSIEEQLKYKYQLNIDGGVTAWHRLPWQMASNSVVMYLRPLNCNLLSPDKKIAGSQYYEWYYCLFDKFQLENKRLPFVYVDMHNILLIKKQLDDDMELAKAYVNSGKEFARDYLSEESKMRYIEELFEEINSRTNQTGLASC